MEQYNRISPCIKAELSKSKPLKRNEETALFNEYSSSTNSARKEEIFNKIIVSNIKFVFAMANQFSKQCNVSLDDLYSEGKCGLIEAFHKYDPTVGIKFISFAVYYIKRALYTCVSEDDLVRIPIALKSNVSKKKKNSDEDSMTDREKIAHSVMTNIRQAVGKTEDSEQESVESTADLVHDDIGDMEVDNLKDVLWNMLKKTLDDNELYIIQYSFGLKNDVILPARDIADNLNMKLSDFQKIKKAAYEKIRLNDVVYGILKETVNA